MESMTAKSLLASISFANACLELPPVDAEAHKEPDRKRNERRKSLNSMQLFMM
jgi:hypothetical protein